MAPRSLGALAHVRASAPPPPLISRSFCVRIPTRALEDAIYEEARHEEECTRAHVVRALLAIDREATEKLATQVSHAGRK